MARATIRLSGLLLLVAIVVVAFFAWDNLREYTIYERQAEIVHLEDARQLSSDLYGYLSDPSYEVRARAAMAVGRVGGGDAAGRLLPMLSDSSQDVAAAAAFAIGLTGDRSQVTPLLDIAFDLPARVAEAAVRSVGRLADTTMKPSVNRLTDYLAHPGPEVRAATCYALADIGANGKSQKIVNYIRSETSSAGRAAGLYALARLKARDAEVLFTEYLADADPFVRQSCVRGLGSCKTKEARHLLAMALNDGDDNVVVEAIRRLGPLEDKAAGDQLVRRFETARQDRIATAILRALRERDDRGAIEAAAARLGEETSPWLTGEIIRYLAAVQGDAVVALLDSLSADSSRAVRLACAEAYGLIADEKVVPRLVKLFSDDDPAVRAEAFGGLCRLDSTNLEFYVTTALSDSDWVVQALGIDLIGTKKLSRFLGELGKLNAGRDTLESDLRRSLATAAAALIEDYPTDSTVAAAFKAGLTDRSYLVRRETAELYREKFGEDTERYPSRARTRIRTSRLANMLQKAAAGNPRAVIETERGPIEMELLTNVAPLTVANFMELARDGFYDGLVFHRIVPGFVAQGGDPRGDGWGGPPWNIRCEYSAKPYRRGTVGIATSGKDSGGSQFFITLSPQPRLEGRYTVFGIVRDGMDAADELMPGDRILGINIIEGS